MKPSFAHKKDIKKSVKSTYAQSYPHFPQKNMETRPKNTVKNRKYVLCKMLYFLIEKNTRYGIIYLQSVDTKSAVKDTVIPSFSWEIGAKTDCNKTRRS
mgnify:CR=1 FL=1